MAENPEIPAVKEYKYGGHSFRLLPNTIKLLNLAAPVLIKYRKLEYQHTKDIDLTTVHEIRMRFDELKDSINDLESVPEAERDIKRIESLKETLKAEQLEFESDTSLQNGIELYNDCVALAMFELVTDISLMRPLMDNILVGDVKAGTLDYTDPKIVDFIKEVIADFFLISLKSKAGLNPR